MAENVLTWEATEGAHHVVVFERVNGITVETFEGPNARERAHKAALTAAGTCDLIEATVAVRVRTLSSLRSVLRNKSTKRTEALSPIVADVAIEVQRATTKFPTWPTDPLHAVAVLQEEVGELTKEVLQLTYEPGKSSRDAVRKEAIQTAAMAMRFLMSLDRYEYSQRPQHLQDLKGGACE